jgi:hypothetical protein
MFFRPVASIKPCVYFFFSDIGVFGVQRDPEGGAGFSEPSEAEEGLAEVPEADGFQCDVGRGQVEGPERRHDRAVNSPARSNDRAFINCSILSPGSGPPEERVDDDNAERIRVVAQEQGE